MAQPKGYVDESKPDHVFELHKALYGLKQAPRAWFECLKTTLLQWGFRSSHSDSSVFFLHRNGSPLFLLVYVNDILITGGDSSTITSLNHDLNLTFALKDLGPVRYFLGFEVSRTPSGLHLSQTKYASDLLSRTNLADAKPSPTLMCLGHKLYLSDSLLFYHPFLYHSTVGALQYLTHTRLDIAYTVNKLSQFLQAPTLAHWAACKRLLRYIKGTIHYGLSFHPAKVFSLEGYSDADWATSIDDRNVGK